MSTQCTICLEENDNLLKTLGKTQICKKGCRGYHLCPSCLQKYLAEGKCLWCSGVLVTSIQIEPARRFRHTKRMCTWHIDESLHWTLLTIMWVVGYIVFLIPIFAGRIDIGEMVIFISLHGIALIISILIEYILLYIETCTHNRAFWGQVVRLVWTCTFAILQTTSVISLDAVWYLLVCTGGFLVVYVMGVIIYAIVYFLCVWTPRAISDSCCRVETRIRTIPAKTIPVTEAFV